MVRRAAILAAAALLSGCAHSRYVEHPITAWFAPPAASGSDVPVGAAEKHCRALAKRRMDDAMFQGEDETTQRTVYRLAHDDCIAWSGRHAGPP